MRYFDLHCDTLSKCFDSDAVPAVTAEKGRRFEQWYQCFAVFISDRSSNPQLDYSKQKNLYKRRFEKSHKPKSILTLENGLPIDSLEFVDVLKADNVRAVTLTWNGENQIAGGADSDAGLKPFGRQVIGRLNEDRIACDLSHLNRKSFFKAGELAERVFASHSCCDKTHRHPRNLTDEQIKYISSRGGVIGLCFYPEFLGTKYSFEGVWRHINHLLNMGFEDLICIGSDFDGADMSDCLDGVDKIPDLYCFLSGKGIDRSVLNKIFFDNAYNFFKNF